MWRVDETYVRVKGRWKYLYRAIDKDGATLDFFLTDRRNAKKVSDEFDADRRPMGVTGHAVYQSVDDPNDITVWHDFATREEAEAFASSERLRDAMHRAGVLGRSTVWFVKEA